ncbi:MAG TPA: site-specific integrase [Thiotrichaceae bacterium]|jgi:integrase|nr:site-specific integrase [Thiotrichaceae bacterium]
MARLAQDSKLLTREARSKLKPSHEPYWKVIEPGFHLGYRKGKQGKAGTWIARYSLEGKYKKKSLGNADDYRDDNGVDVLKFGTAQIKAREWATSLIKKSKGIHEGPFKVKDAIKEYMDWFEVHRKSVNNTQSVFDFHIIPKFGDIEVSEITTRQIRKWHESLAKQPAKIRTGKTSEKTNYKKVNDDRSRKATANRVLTVFKAALNHAWREGFVESDNAWRRVRPFRNVDQAKIQYLTEKECKRLINVCPADFRSLVQGALYTGCRYGELINMKCEDFNTRARVISIPDSKSGKTRHVPVTDQGKEFFKRQKAGRKGSELMFRKKNGEQWGKSHQIRLIKNASKTAKIDPPATFHILRHTYGSGLAMNAVPLQVIAEALGHADTRITNKHYAHLMPSYVADTIRANLPDFGKFEKDNVREI